MRFNNVHLILTVEHIFDGSNEDDILVNLGIKGQHYPMKKMDVWKDTNLDLCFFRLDDFEVKTFQNSAIPFEYRSRVNQTPIGPNDRAAICGYPTFLTLFNEESHVLKVETFLNITKLIHTDDWPKKGFDITKNPDDNFLLAHGKKHGGKYLNEEGKPTDPIKPFGLSGAGVWLIDITKENEETPIYTLFGIQTGYFSEFEYLCGSFIEPMINEIKKNYKQ